VDVPLAVPTDEFRITAVLVVEEVRVLLRDVNWDPDAISAFFLGVVDGEFEPPRREDSVVVAFDSDAVVTEDEWLLGIFAWVLVRPDFARLLFGGGVEVRVVTVNGILERCVFAFDEAGFPLGERVEFDPYCGGDVAVHRYCPVCASMYSSMV